MADPDRPLLADAKEELGRLAGELSEMLRLRWQLAKLEMADDARSIKRLATCWIAAGVMFLTGLPLLFVFLAEILDGALGIPRFAWLSIFAATLWASATLTAWLAWRRFRRDFVGLAETVEEIREDLEWLGEWRSEGEG